MILDKRHVVLALIHAGAIYSRRYIHTATDSGNRPILANNILEAIDSPFVILLLFFLQKKQQQWMDENKIYLMHHPIYR